MPNHEKNARVLLVDGLTLVYHEARHVRFLIEKGYLPSEGWEQLVSLPRNRVEAWRQLQPIRKAALGASTTAHAAALFERKLRRSVEQLANLYDNSHWKHAAAVGGHAWRGVTARVLELGQAIETQDAALVIRACDALVGARHNNGLIRDKLLDLDQAISVVSDGSWE